jgi:hypothetical protein
MTGFRPNGPRPRLLLQAGMRDDNAVTVLHGPMRTAPMEVPVTPAWMRSCNPRHDPTRKNSRGCTQGRSSCTCLHTGAVCTRTDSKAHRGQDGMTTPRASSHGCCGWELTCALVGGLCCNRPAPVVATSRCEHPPTAGEQVRGTGVQHRKLILKRQATAGTRTTSPNPASWEPANGPVVAQSHGPAPRQGITVVAVRNHGSPAQVAPLLWPSLVPKLLQAGSRPSIASPCGPPREQVLTLLDDRQTRARTHKQTRNET